MAFNEDGFYKVVTKCVLAGQDIINILWYKIGLDILPGNLSIAGAEDLARLVDEQVWQPHWKGRVSSDVLMDTISVYPYDNEFQLITQLPFVRNVGEYGSNVGNYAGQALCVNFKFNLEPTSLLSGLLPPKSGYIAWGPVFETNVDNAMRLDGESYSLLTLVADDFAKDLVNIVPPYTFEPIRLRRKKIAGIVTVQGYAGISSATVSHVASFRRSRVPKEG